MIARLTVGTPFAFLVPEGATYRPYSYEEEGYTITARPPVASDVPFRSDLPSQITVDGQPAFVANAIQFDFHREEFNRRRGQAIDPPLDLMQRVVSSFLARLRHTAQAFQIVPLELSGGTTWRLQYLNDDSSELTAETEHVRARGGRQFSFSFTGVSPALWDAMHDLDTNWAAPVWRDILLDATHSFPRIGTSLVLAATALEVFVADILERLAGIGEIPADVWKWMNDRDNWLKDPSTEEQLDFLLRHFTGHSLKDEPALWQGFKELRTARNTFVHQGSAVVGGVEVTLTRAKQLVTTATTIIDVVGSWLPTSVQWSRAEVKMDIGFTFPVT